MIGAWIPLPRSGCGGTDAAGLTGSRRDEVPDRAAPASRVVTRYCRQGDGRDARSVSLISCPADPAGPRKLLRAHPSRWVQPTEASPRWVAPTYHPPTG